MRKSKYISGGGETLKTVSTIDNGMHAKIPANSELEGTIMQLHPGPGTSIQPELTLTADNGASSYQIKICDLAYHSTMRTKWAYSVYQMVGDDLRRESSPA